MNFSHAILLGALQGLSEFLPISSSGQLVIFESFLPLGNVDESVLKIFDIFLHTGTLLALLVIFKKELWQVLRAVLSCQVLAKENSMALKLLVGTLPAVGLALVGEDFFDAHLRNVAAVAILLAGSGLLFILAERFPKGKTKHKFNLRQAWVVGIFQAFAILPGISRSGSCIAAGLLQGVRRESAAHFSFLLAVPIIAGATMLSLWKIFIENGLAATFWQMLPPPILLAGFATSSVVSFFTAKILLRIFRQVSLRPFAIFLFVESACLIFSQLQNG